MTSDVDLLRDTDLLYPEHDRNSCSDESPINVEAAGSYGCARCTAIALARGEASEARANRLREEVDSLRSRLEDTTRDKLNAEARAERLAEALRRYGQHDDTCGVLVFGQIRCTCGFSAALQDQEDCNEG